MPLLLSSPLLLSDMGDSRPAEADRGVACLRRFWPGAGLGVGVGLPPATAAATAPTGGDVTAAATATAPPGGLLPA